jgi:uncharacterized protein with PIN domain
LPGRRLLTLAAREGRTVLTREATLARARSTTRVLVVEADRFRDQLREVDRSVPLGGRETRQPRCGDCNAVLEPISREALPGGVPPYVLATQGDFRRCPRCRRIFWRATHWRRMEAEIEALSLSRPPGV